MSDEKLLYIMVGLPCSGKSTYLRNEGVLPDSVLSSDAVVDLAAARLGKTYNEVFREFVDVASRICKSNLDFKLKIGQSPLYLDRTNLTRKGRADFIQRAIKEGYECVCVNFEMPKTDEEFDELRFRNEYRKNFMGKDIPQNIITNMIATYEEPSMDENFIDIIKMNTWS